MATNAYILAKISPQQARLIYVHFDGGIWGVGTILSRHYTTDELVQALVERGDVSSLDETIHGTAFYNEPDAEIAVVDIPYPYGQGNQIEKNMYYWDGTTWYTRGGKLEPIVKKYHGE